MGRARIGVLLLPLLLSGCSSPPELQWEGEHVRLGAEDPEAICGGTRAYLDRRAGELMDRFGTSHTIDYYWVPSGVDPFCPDNAAGCVSDRSVYSLWIPHEHELAHAASTGMPRALEEGLATHWGDSWPIYALAPRDQLYPLLLQQVEITQTDEYARVAHFLAYLSENYGWESLAELDRTLDEESSADDVNQAFIEVFGMSLDGAMMAYADYPDCRGIVDMSLACDKEPTVLGFLSVTMSREVDCAASDILGPFNGMAFAEEVVEVTPAIDGNRMIRARGDGIDKGGRVVIRRCGPCSENGVLTLINSGLAFIDEDELPAGRYVVRFYAPAGDTPATFELLITG
jgi:hypothetical protein